MDSLVQANNLAKAIFAWFGNTTVLGITLDIPAHIVGGAAIFYFFAARGYRTWACVAIVMGCEAAKEAYDVTAMLHAGDYLEPFKDFLFTMVGMPIGYYLSRPVEELLDNRED